MKNAKKVAEMAEIQKVLINRLNKVMINEGEKPADLAVLVCAVSIKVASVVPRDGGVLGNVKCTLLGALLPLKRR